MDVKRIAIVVILLMLLPSSFSVNERIFSYETDEFRCGNIFYVGGSGPDNYTKIQEAINDAEDGDIIFIYDDSSPYYERLVINKSITLKGENKETTIIEFTDSPTILVEANGVTISNLFIKNLNNSAIYVDTWSENTTISNNIIFIKDEMHLALCLLSNHNIVSNNIFINGGILGGSYPNNIYNNTVNGLPLIYLEGVHDISVEGRAGQIILINCKNVSVIRQNITNNFIAIGIYHSKRCYIYDCNISHNWKGMEIIDSSGIFIEKNRIEDSAYGIYLEAKRGKVRGNIITSNQFRGLHIAHSKDIMVKENNITNNGKGLYLQDSKRCLIYRNNFINNQKHAEFGYVAAISRAGIHQTLTNLWLRNYWGDGIYPQVIKGEVMWYIFGIIFYTPWIQFDWIPSLQSIDLS